MAALSPAARGVVLLILALTMFDLMSAVIKHLGTAYTPQQLSFFRNLFGLVPVLAVLGMSGEWRRAGRPLKIRQWRLGVMRGGLGVLAQVCFYLSLVHLEFATAATLAFVSPLIITAMSVPVLGERVGPWRWGAVVIGFIGVVTVMRPGSEVFTIYSLLPVCAAFCYASLSVSSRLFDSDVPTPLLNLYAAAGAAAVSLVLVLVTGGYNPVQSVQDWMWLMGMGACGGFAVLLLVTAYRQTPPGNLAPFEFFGIPLAFIIGWIIFDEAPFERLFPGVLLIIAGGLLIFWRERVNRARARAAAKTAAEAGLHL
ncbi:MAG: DMT family transporter [Rhodospirillales bacterium]